MSDLLRYDAACRAVSEAKTLDEVRDWLDKAAAVREYARRARNRQLEIDAIEIRVRAKRRRGEMLAELREQGVLVEGRRKTVTDEGQFQRVTLDDLDTTRNESSEDQKIAAIEPDAFERLIARCRAHMEANPERHAMDILREQRGGPVDNARATAPRRMEPDDSLDYFPTPPWATRTLMEVVLPHLGVRHVAEAREPACGDGLMAEVLREYVPVVHAADIHDYGYEGQGVGDFLSAGPEACAEWVITNPPFGDVALPFVSAMLDFSHVGAAAFVRSQWAIEGVTKWERLYRHRPPTLVAFFMERVPLHKGRWEPEGDTMTAYAWLVWLHRFGSPQPPLWIPPGQRKSRTRPGDVEHFTQQPVPRRDIALDAPVDLITGEILAPTDETEHGDESGRAACDARSAEQDGTSQATTADPAADDAAEPIGEASPSGPGAEPLDAARPPARPSDDALDIPPFLKRGPNGELPEWRKA